MLKTEFAGTGILTRFILKRDKFFIPLWMIGMLSLSILIAPVLGDMFPTYEDRMMMAETMKNPAMIAMCGPCYDFENYGNGALYAQMMLIWCALLWGVMNIFLVVRHTRKDEEEGRLELIRTLPTGRQSGLLSIIYVALMTNILVSVLIGIGIGAMGIEDMDMAGSMLFGFCMGITGLVFAGITLVFSQVSSTSRGATGYPLALLGFFYLLRASGDISAEWVSNLSPLGLITRTEVYVNDKWWPIIVLLVLSVILFLLAFRLNAGRDIEQGLIAARKGRSHGSRLLSSSFGLSLRLLRSTIIAWAITIYILGAAYGSIFGDIESFVESSGIIRAVFMSSGGTEAQVHMQFVDTLMVIMSIIATVAVLMVVFRLRGEEKRGRLDDILARNVSRIGLMGGYVVIAVVFTVILQLLTVFGLWQAASMVMDEPMALSDVMKSGMIYVPAMLVFVGIGTAIVGILPRGTIIAWLFLGYAFFMDYLGGILDLPEWTGKITPFGATPKVPIEEFDAIPVSILLAVTAALLVVGFIGFRNRDIRQN